MGDNIKSEGEDYMNPVCIIFGLIFILAGILFATGKFNKYIGEIKNLTEEEKMR